MKSILSRSMLLAPVLFAACADAGPGNAVSLSFSSRAPGAAAVAPLFSVTGALGDTIRNGADVLIVDKVEIVLRQIELAGPEVADCDVSPRPAACRDFKTDPMVLDLPLGAGVAQAVSVQIPPGTYDEVEFEVHKLSSGDSRDAALRTQRPDLLDRSIRVQGKFNGTAFTYDTDLDVEQELELTPPLVVTGSGGTNLTIRVTIASWFKTGSGALVDPATANKGGTNEGLVKENIKVSFKAFEDKDSDGDDRDG
jgi:hypothetical protein